MMLFIGCHSLATPCLQGDTPDAAVKYAINRAAEKIKANINRTEIPDGLHYTWVDMAAGLFLR